MTVLRKISNKQELKIHGKLAAVGAPSAVKISSLSYSSERLLNLSLDVLLNPSSGGLYLEMVW